MCSSNSPEEEWPFVSCTVKVSNSKKNTTRTKRMIHNMLFLVMACLNSIECNQTSTKWGLINSKQSPCKVY